MSEKISVIALFVLWVCFVCTSGVLAGQIKEPKVVITMGDMLISDVKYLTISNVEIHAKSITINNMSHALIQGNYVDMCGKSIEVNKEK